MAGSIRVRFLIAAALSVIAALAIAKIGITYLFERHVERRIDAELTNHMNQLIAGLAVADDGSASVTEPPSDPRFSVPLSGLYWQAVDEASGDIIRSRSLWDAQLAVPDERPASGAPQFLEMKGPNGRLVVAVERKVREAAHNDRSFRVVVALDHSEVDAALQEFSADIVPSLAILAGVLILAAWLQVAVGLRPLERIRHGLGEIVAGRSSRMATEVPSELRPLVGEINRLLESQAQVLAKARARAADLAHGLKTPLQVLAADIRTLRAKGETTAAGHIDQVATTIRRHVERELARSRAASGPGTRLVACSVAEVARRVVDVVKRTPRGEHLEFVMKVGPEATSFVDEVDLAEILGNLIENASRFARTRILIEASATATTTTITIVDDGPGIPEEAKMRAMVRGERLDSAAMVPDSTSNRLRRPEAYGGTLSLEDA
jgi:signal transduction histidine kinase